MDVEIHDWSSDIVDTVPSRPGMAVQVMPSDLRVGDVIVPTRPREREMPIQSIKPHACSNGGYHINGNNCYMRSIPIWVRKGGS